MIELTNDGNETIYFDCWTSCYLRPRANGGTYIVLINCDDGIHVQESIEEVARRMNIQRHEER